MTVLIFEDETYGADNQWTVVEQIGKGSFGEVWRVRDRESGLIAAMKCYEGKDVYVEAHVLKKLEFCGYVPARIDRFFLDSTNQAIVMSIGSSDLFKLRSEGEDVFAKKTVLSIAWHLFTAMEYIHARNVVHRDLKEANIVMKENPEVMTAQPFFIIDWGIAIPYDAPEIEIENPPFGTQTYCSPHMHNRMPASKRDDLTMIIYMLLLERGNDNFSDLFSSYDKREKFEVKPEDFVKSTDIWIVEVAKRVFARPHNTEPDYAGVLAVIKNAEPGFEPDKHIFEIQEKEDGKRILL